MEENLKWLWYAFSVAWTLHILYLGSLSVREKKLREQLATLKAVLEESTGEKA
jgi:bacteriorhodopsin